MAGDSAKNAALIVVSGARAGSLPGASAARIAIPGGTGEDAGGSGAHPAKARHKVATRILAAVVVNTITREV